MKVGLAILAAVAGVALAGSAQAAGYTETFNSATVGAQIDQVSGWYSTNVSNLGWATINASSGVAGTQGVTAGEQAFNWTARTFDWTAMAVGTSVVIGGDWQAGADGRFNDDRMGWTTTGATGTSSTYHFGTQLDNTDNGGFVTYWKASPGTIYQTITALPTITASAWYRATTTVTKLGAAAAKLDVTFQALDASGNPTGTLYTGSLADTSALGTSSAPASYFTAAVTPMFKDYNQGSGIGGFDNAYFQDSVPEPTTLSLLGLGCLALMGRRRHA